MSITRTAIVDDNGSGMTGTVLDNAWKQEFYDQIDAADAALSSSVTSSLPASRTETGTGSITALTLPSGTGNLVVYMNNASLATIKGIAAGTLNQRLTILSIGAGQVDFTHQDGAAAAGTKLFNYATTGTTSIQAGVGSATFIYDSSSRWRMVHHEQGGWITPTHNGGNYTALTGTWTVDSGDITTIAYYLRGRTMTVAWYFGATSVSATPSQLFIGNGAYGGHTTAKTILAFLLYNDNGGGNTNGWCQATAAGTTILLSKTTGSFSASTNNTNVFGEITFEVQ